MSVTVNPSLLQLAALGIEDDDYVTDGVHLRWRVSPELGFPRSGFELLRRPAPLPWDSKRRDVPIRRARPAGDEIVAGQLRHPEGLHMTAEEGVQASTPANRVAVGGDTVRVRFVEGGSPTAAPTPACWVMVHFRHRRTGSLAASAVHVDGEQHHVQDRGASGRRLRLPLERLLGRVEFDALEKLRRLNDVEYLPTMVDATLDDQTLERRGADRPKPDGEEPIGRRGFPFGGRRPFGGRPFRRFQPLIPDRPIFQWPWSRDDEPDAPDEWIRGTFLLHGSVIDEIRLTGRAAEIELLEWITVEEYATTDGWEPVETLFLPIDGDDVTYPRQPTAGETVARERLKRAPPKALGPWTSGAWPPTPATDAEVEADRQARYLDGYDELAAALETLLRTEMEDAVPQRAVRYGADEPMSAVDGTSPQLDGATMEFPLLDMLQVAAVDPGLARLLGLGTVDTPGADQVDYLVRADWWSNWLLGLLSPHLRDRALETYAERDPDENGVRLPLPVGARTGRDPTGISIHQQRIVSVATGNRVSSREPVPEPTGLASEATARTGLGDVPAVVGLSWDRSDGNLFTEAGHVAFGLRRRHGNEDVSLARSEPGSLVSLPHLPAGEENTFTDRQPTAGDATYRVSGMDLWGRWSDFAETNITVTDTIAPPAPTGLEAQLLGDGGPTWSLELSFDWTAGQRTLAPDTARFEVVCEQRRVPYDFTGWDRVETREMVRRPLTIDWPALSITTPLQGVTASVEPRGAEADSGADARVTVVVPNVHVPFDGEHRARCWASVVAFDDAGNRSDPARRVVAERVDPMEPATEPLVLEPQVATWPDTERHCHWTVEWTAQPSGSRTRVLSASQARLLAAVDESVTTFESRDTTDRVQRLREIATDEANQHVFSPAHREPYDEATRHQLSLPAGDRGWTVVTVRHTGPTGTRSPWPSDPDRFAVVRTPPAVGPPVPNLVATTAPDAPGEIGLTIAPDASGITETVRLYRTSHREAVDDLRRMRPLAPLAADPSSPVELQDLVEPDRWYAYRAVGVAASGKRSAPTAAVWIRASTTQPPAVPTIEAISQPGAGSRDRKIEVTVAGYALTVHLERRPAGAGPWADGGRWSLAELTGEASPRAVTLPDRVPSDKADALFEYRVRVTDRRGMAAESDVGVR